MKREKEQSKDAGREKEEKIQGRKKDTVMLLIVNKSSLFGYKPY
jgi:hypothetical protein